jgi:hypothetical protein
MYIFYNSDQAKGLQMHEKGNERFPSEIEQGEDVVQLQIEHVKVDRQRSSQEQVAVDNRALQPEQGESCGAMILFLIL